MTTTTTSSYNFDEDILGPDVHVPVMPFSHEASTIQQNISLFVEVMDSLQSDEDVKQNELLKEIYVGQFQGMQAKLSLLINNYQDNEETLANLLDLHDWMEGVLAQYLRRVGTPGNTHNTNNNINNKEHKIPTIEKKKKTTADDGSDDSSASDSESYSNSNSKSSEDSEEQYLAPKREPSKHHRQHNHHQHNHHHHHHARDGGEDKDTIGKGKDKVQEGESQGELNSTTVVVSNGELGPLGEPSPKPLVKSGYKPAEAPGECPICCEEEVPPSDLFIFDVCSHQYCRECLQGYYSNRIHEGKVLDITCPAPGCKTVVEYSQVQSVVTAEMFSKYEEFTFIASLNADPSVKWCPKPGCGNAIIGDPDNPRCQCTNPECKYEFCFLCSEPWHDNFTCDQYQQWKVENGMIDTKFTHWAKKNAKKCPQCKTLIEKMAGCNHMTCSNCKFEFCWLCGGRYTSNHFDVFNVLGCPGMQSGSKQFGVARRIGMRALIGTGIVLGGIIGTALAIPAAVVAGPIYGGYKLHQRRKRNNRRRRHYHM